MKKLLFLSLILIISCSKKEVEQEMASGYDYSQKLPYDTTAIDSFAPGANPGNVVMKRVVVDSAYLAKAEEQKIIAKKKKEEADKKLAEEKLKQEEKKKAEEKKKQETPKKEIPQPAGIPATEPVQL